MTRLVRGLLFSVSVAAISVSALPVSAQAVLATDPPQDVAQTAPVPAKESPTSPVDSTTTEQRRIDDAAAADIVVTGTFIRGVGPVGTNAIALGAAQIQALGTTDSNQILARIPQVTNFFNTTPAVPGGSALVAVTPQIRGLSTLVLLDGHRLASAGTITTGVDPSIIPQSVLDRVEVVPDGGSAIYGSDAVGGVINFTTKRKFDGMAGGVRGGVADGYKSVTADAIAGKDWGSGSLYVAYEYAWHDRLLGRDRDYVKAVQPSSACSPGTVSVTGANGAVTTYGLPDRRPDTVAQCDQYAYLSLLPSEKRHSVFASLSQQLNPAILIDIKGYYSSRRTVAYADQLTASGTITSANPYFRPIAGETSQSVAFSFAGAIGGASPSPARLEQWGLAPEVSVKLGADFRLRVLGNYSRSYSFASNPLVNTGLLNAALAGTTTATALNPYDPGASASSIVQAVTGDTSIGESKSDIGNVRAVVDGSLLAIAGGDVKVAAGGEVIDENYSPVFAIRTLAGAFPRNFRKNSSRVSKSVFGEMQVPLVGAANRMPFVYSLRLDVAGRYDHYSDFGGTTNPKVGASWMPAQWLTVRANWGKSFVAPALSDSQAVDTRADVLPISPFIRPGDPTFPNFLRPTILLAGGNPGLKPQKATTWAAGFDVKPAGMPGLSLSGTYYNVRYRDLLSIAPFFNPVTLYTPPYAGLVTLNPTLAQAQGIVGNLPIEGAANLASLYGGPFGGPYVLIDARRYNLAALNTDGIDGSVNVRQDTGFGSLDAGISGNYVLSRDAQAGPGQAFASQSRYDLPRLTGVASLGVTAGGLRASASLNYTGGYDLAPNRVVGQSRVRAYKTVDLFVAYMVRSEGPLKDLQITLNLNNAFDEDPPFYAANGGYIGGNVIGRYAQLGLRKAF